MTRLYSNRYSIEIVPADRGWILETIAQAIAREAENQSHRFSVRIVNSPTDTADLTFFLPESAYRPLNKSITVTYLAHKEVHPGAAALFEDIAKKSDYCITSSSKYQQILKEDGAKKVFKISLGVDTTLFIPKLKLGVVGRTYGTGRKGETLLADLAGMPMIELHFTGEGWPYPADHYSNSDLARFYQNIDYLLVPSLIEGGPASLLEALSAGCPVIAPTDIGLVEDFPHISYIRGDAKDLQRVVLSLLEKKLALRNSVLDCDWKVFAQRHLALFAELIEQRRSAQPQYMVLPSPAEEEPLRVLLVTHGPEDVAKGGPSTRVSYIVSRLRAAGHFAQTRHNIRSVADLADFDIVHVFNSWPPQTAIDCLALVRNAGKTAIFSPVALDLGDWAIYRQLLQHAFASRSKESVELVLEQLPELSKQRHYDGADADEPMEGIPGQFESLRKCCALADQLVFLSEHERSFLRALGAKVESGTLIHNGVPDVFGGDVDPVLFRERHGLSKYVLCVGRIEYRKNQALLAKAMECLDIPLVLIGDVGDAGYLDHVKMLAGPNLHHFARIDDKEVLASAYAGASVFVLPSWSEGAPLAALEAGLTGVPLVLSDRSGEREYFGEHAEYVSPTDVASMRATIMRVLDRTDPLDARAERALFLRKRYSEAEHVQRTVDLYRSALARRHVVSDSELVIDVSSLVHALQVGGHHTGVPLVESNLIARIMATCPSTRCITYSDRKGCFIEVAYRDLEHFDLRSFQRRYRAENVGHGDATDSRVELMLPIRLQRDDDWAAWALEPLARAGMSPKGLRWTRRRMKWLRKRLRAMKILSKPSAKHRVKHATDIDFSDVKRYLSKRRVPRQSLAIPPGSRILTLGQGWLSNEPLLDRLVELAAGRRLEAYVYDISYVSGAHYSGWVDNEERVRRLTKLLRHCKIVFTESITCQLELAKFGKTRGLSYEIVRTRLRGKDSTVKSARQPGQEIYVLYVSSFNRRKNHDLIVNVWKDLLSSNAAFAALGAKLLLVGEIQSEAKYGDPAHQTELLRHNIRVITNANDRQLAAFYDHCLFTVYPSLQEGWGIPVQESLMHGKVCLVAQSVPAAQEIANAALIKLDPNDFFGWREAILTWATNDRMRAAFEERAAQYVPPTWQDIARCVIEGRESSSS
jgi:glycosyltransferase involved in cell wall biosynthesis